MYISSLSSSSVFEKARGFTLLEVMIALVIFGLVATVIQKVTSQNIAQYERIRLKTIANWIAENKMVEVHNNQRDVMSVKAFSMFF